ncbi:MAG: hypothetical protein K2X45_07920 [Phreatobacter sp.]|nr:hypothetical protein [Phreatobacter sp.]
MPTMLYVSKTIAFPVRPSGRDIVDQAGRVLATAATPIMADAIADAMNLGEPAILAREADHDDREHRIGKMLLSKHEHDRMERTLALANKAHGLMG